MMGSSKEERGVFLSRRAATMAASSQDSQTAVDITYNIFPRWEATYSKGILWTGAPWHPRATSKCWIAWWREIPAMLKLHLLLIDDFKNV